jgi:hypothetical protein
MFQAATPSCAETEDVGDFSRVHFDKEKQATSTSTWEYACSSAEKQERECVTHGIRLATG